MYSRHLTIANGVQGRIDLTVPGGASSEVGGSIFEGAEACGKADRSEAGSTKRMLLIKNKYQRYKRIYADIRGVDFTCGTSYSET